MFYYYAFAVRYHKLPLPDKFMLFSGGRKSSLPVPQVKVGIG